MKWKKLTAIALACTIASFTLTGCLSQPASAPAAASPAKEENKEEKTEEEKTAGEEGAEEKSGEKAPRVCELPTAEFAELLAEWREHAAEVKKKNVAERRKAAKRRAEEG